MHRTCTSDGNMRTAVGLYGVPIGACHTSKKRKGPLQGSPMAELFICQCMPSEFKEASVQLGSDLKETSGKPCNNPDDS